MPRNTKGFAAIVKRRQDELGLTQLDIAARGGPSDSTFRKIVDGEKVNIAASTLRKLDVALEWQPGAAAQWLANPGVDGEMPPTAEADRPLTSDGRSPRFDPGSDAMTSVPLEQALLYADDVTVLLEALAAGDAEQLGEATQIVAAGTLAFVSSVTGGARRKYPNAAGRMLAIARRVIRLDGESPYAIVGLPDRPRPNIDLAHVPEGTEIVVQTKQFRVDVSPDLSAAIVARSLNEHHAEMRRRAQQQRERRTLIDQAKRSLGDTDSPLTGFPREVDDAAYVQYLAARLSTPHQGGDPDLHAQLSLSPAEYEAAQTRYRREFSEMVVFDGVIRTVETESSGRSTRPDSREDTDGYDSNLMKWRVLIEADAPSVPDFVRAAVPARMIDAYQAAIDDIPKRAGAIPDATRRGEPVTVEMVGALLRAIDNLDSATRDIVTRMQDLELHATQQQIDVALPLFEVGWEFSDELITFIDTLLPAAPSKGEISKLRKVQASLRSLSEFHHDAHDAWVESGRSSRPGVSRVRSNVPDLTPEEFLPGGVDPTSSGDKQADHG